MIGKKLWFKILGRLRHCHSFTCCKCRAHCLLLRQVLGTSFIFLHDLVASDVLRPLPPSERGKVIYFLFIYLFIK